MANDEMERGFIAKSDDAPEASVPMKELVAIQANHLLRQFLAMNPIAKIHPLTDHYSGLERVWGETGLSLLIPPEPDPIHEALNHSVLPDRYSAIWHTDTRDLEVIFTAYELSRDFRDIKGREFDFIFRENTYRCGFFASSERLITIAGSMVKTGQSPTDWRNLSSFYDYAHRRDEPDTIKPIYDPISFWIRDVNLLHEDETLDLINHLNFFMVFYDTASPRILVHSASPAAPKTKSPIRYTSSTFPTQIRGRDLDDNLHQFWDASLKGDAIRRFLYNYQIIEYAAVYFVDDDVKRTIKRILHAPDALSNVDGITESLVDALSPLKMNEVQKRSSLLKQCVSSENIWAEIQHRKEYFEAKVEFDGGYSCDPYVVKDMRFVTFNNNWSATFEAAIRNIRNGLSHGKEFSKSGVISPTIANQDKIQPWLGPLSLAARQVMLFRGVL